MTEQTLARARAGDQDAFRELTDPYRRELQLHLYRIVGSTQDAEDLLQETLLAAWRGLEQFQGRASLRAWLYRIATNRSLDALRASRRRPEDLLRLTDVPTPTRRSEPIWLEPYPDVLLDGIPDDAPGPEARYEAKESVGLAFIVGLQHIPAQQRAVLVLRDVLGFRAAEVAAMLQTTEPSVNSLLQRARAAFDSRLPAAGRERAPLPNSKVERDIVGSFADAFDAGDIDAVVALLTDDAWLTMPPEPFEYQGPTAIAAFLRDRDVKRGALLRLVPTRANGQPAFACYLPSAHDEIARPYGMVALALEGARISAITWFADSSVFPHFGLPSVLRAHQEAKGGSPLGGTDHRRSCRPFGPLGEPEGPQEATMTKQADFKRRVRARMATTGESYAAARAQLLADPERALHVTNGDSTVQSLARTGLADRIIPWRDMLHEGPVPAVPDSELRRVRAAFLAEHEVDHALALRLFEERDRALTDNRHGRFVLWFEADLYDQLQIIQILARLAALGVDPSRISLICIGEYPGIAHFGGLGELEPEQLLPLPAAAGVELSPAALRLATDAWAAFRAPQPSGIGPIARAQSPELRFLAEAFDRLGREYPSTRDGLALTERRILAAAAEGHATAGAIFLRLAEREARPYLGDTWAFAIMERLARAGTPLLAPAPAGRVTFDTPLALTSSGRALLAGEADHVALNGIDRWIGGVHLVGPEAAWHWDEGTESIRP